MRLKNLRETFVIKAAPERIFEAFMGSEQHAAFTGYPATLSRRVGGRFTTCGERNSGVNVALQPGVRIIQAWTHKDWPKHHYSIVSIRLKPIKQGTRVVFHQVGIPSSAFPWVAKGWEDSYWKPLKKHFKTERPRKAK